MEAEKRCEEEVSFAHQNALELGYIGDGENGRLRCWVTFHGTFT